jgi:hypothetical protein
MVMATSENESDWLQSAFIEDRMAVQMESVQDRQFLRTGVRPTAGQRVELKIFIRPKFAPTAISTNNNKEEEEGGGAAAADKEGKGNDGKNGVVWCGFSGQVTRVAREPAKWFPKSHTDDKKGSKALSFFLGSKIFRPPNTTACAQTKTLLPNSTFSPCFSCGEKDDCKGGELFLPQQDWEELQDQQAPLDLSFPMNLLGGVKHGQEVICEGRLNFDHDSTYCIYGTRLHYICCVSLLYWLESSSFIFISYSFSFFFNSIPAKQLRTQFSFKLPPPPFINTNSAPGSRRGSLEGRHSL